LFDDSLFSLIFQATDSQSGSLHQGVQHKSNKFVPRNNTRVAPRLSNIQKNTKSSTSRIVSYRLKRFPRTKQVFLSLSYRLKRFRGTKFRF